MTITEKNTKSEIISHSCEIIDTQANKINRLEGDNKALIFLLSITFAFTFIF